MKWLLASAVAAAAVALLIAHGGSAPAVEPAALLTVRASFDRSLVDFGDAVTARVVATVDRDQVRSGTLRVQADLAPFTSLSGKSESRTVSERLETLTVTQRVACLTAACLARRITLPRIRASATTQDGTPATAATSWPRLQLRSRVTAADLARAEPRFAADTATDPPSFRVAPGRAALALALVAALAAAAAAALAAFEVTRRARRGETTDELERALALVREAEERPAPDRRRALALLARLLRSRDPALERSASDLAWSAPPPEPPAVDELVTRVEQEHAR